MGPVSALIGAGGSILGGLFGRSKQPTAGQNAFSHVKGIMKASKEFGFNPLTLLGAVSPMGGGGTDNSSLGQGIANAALIASDAISAKRETAKRLNDYQTQNQRLQSRLNAITIRPPVPGVYGRARLPSDPGVYGDGAASGGSGGSAAGVNPAGSGGSRAGGSGGVEPQQQSTSTVFTTPGVPGGTEVPEGADLEDIASGLVLDGINNAKADGTLPKNFEQPWYDFGRKVSYGLAVGFDRLHRGVYYGTRAANPFKNGFEYRPGAKQVLFWTHPETGFSGRVR